MLILSGIFDQIVASLAIEGSLLSNMHLALEVRVRDADDAKRRQNMKWMQHLMILPMLVYNSWLIPHLMLDLCRESLIGFGGPLWLPLF